MTLATMTRLPAPDDTADLPFRDLHSGTERFYVRPQVPALPCRLRPGEELLAHVSTREWRQAGRKGESDQRSGRVRRNG
jgi:hypothetical protein